MTQTNNEKVKPNLKFLAHRIRLELIEVTTRLENVVALVEELDE